VTCPEGHSDLCRGSLKCKRAAPTVWDRAL
jgi:hypothetical protein